MIQRHDREGVRLPFGTDPLLDAAFLEARPDDDGEHAPIDEVTAGRLRHEYGRSGPVTVDDESFVIELEGRAWRIPVPSRTTWVRFKPITPAVVHAAEDRAGRPSKLGETIARDLAGRSTELQAATRRDIASVLDRWAAKHRARIEVEVDVEGLDAQGAEKAAGTARDAALEGLAAAASHALSLPGLAARADRLRRLLERIEAGDRATAVDELTGALRAMLDGATRPLTEDDLSEAEYRALTRHRRRGERMMLEEARLTVQVEGWEGDGAHFDELGPEQQTEAVGHAARIRYLGPPKGRPSS